MIRLLTQSDLLKARHLYAKMDFEWVGKNPLISFGQDLMAEFGGVPTCPAQGFVLLSISSTHLRALFVALPIPEPVRYVASPARYRPRISGT